MYDAHIEYGSNILNDHLPFFWRRYSLFAKVNYNQTQHIKINIYRTTSGRGRPDNVLIELNGYKKRAVKRIWTVEIDLTKLWDLKDKMDKLNLVEDTSDDIMLEVFKELMTPII